MTGSENKTITLSGNGKPTTVTLQETTTQPLVETKDKPVVGTMPKRTIVLNPSKQPTQVVLPQRQDSINNRVINLNPNNGNKQGRNKTILSTQHFSCNRAQFW